MTATHHKVELTTTDGTTSVVECSAHQTVLEAAADNGMILPSLCGQGTCGACEARVTEGDVHLGPHDPQLLGKRAASGAVLLCRAEARSDACISLPYAANRILTAQPEPRQATITSMDIVAHATYKVTLQLAPTSDGSTGVEFEPGQFVQLQIPGKDDVRAYSIANCANWDGTLEFFIRFHEGGLFSEFLATKADVGSELIVHGPQGAFHVVEDGMQPRWFVSGGTGLAPLLSMVRRMAEWGEMQPVRVFHGVNRADEVFGVEELHEAGSMLLGGFALDIAVRDEDCDGHVRGTAVDALSRALEKFPAGEELPDVYLCGPPPMVAAAERVAHQAGITDEHLFVEHFVAS